jgi:azurin
MPRYLALIALLLAVPASGCSTPAADSSPAAEARGGGAPAAPLATAPAANDGRAVEITVTDAMKFSVAEITAKRGEKLTVTLVNVGTTPKFSMGHNWVLLTLGTDVPQFLAAAAEAVTTEYVPTATHNDHIVVATKLLGPKERDVVTFVAPDAPGRYDFLCSFPGHYQVGMRGVLIVE